MKIYSHMGICQADTKSNPEDRAIIGNGLSGLDALITTLKNPGLFGAFGSQSLVLIRSDEEMLSDPVKIDPN
jgi:enterochelin esterase-like enzyme